LKLLNLCGGFFRNSFFVLNLIRIFADFCFFWKCLIFIEVILRSVGILQLVAPVWLFEWREVVIFLV